MPTCPMVSTNNRASRRALLEPRRLIWTRTTGYYPIQISLGKISISSSETRRRPDRGGPIMQIVVVMRQEYKDRHHTAASIMPTPSPPRRRTAVLAAHSPRLQAPDLTEPAPATPPSCRIGPPATFATQPPPHPRTASPKAWLSETPLQRPYRTGCGQW